MKAMDDGRIAGAATARYARKKETILAAATAILNRQGVRGMTLADVAASVGLNTTSVTYYYRKKDDLAAACFMRGLERFEAMVEQAAGEATPAARIIKFLDLYLDLNLRVRLGEATPLTSFAEIKALKEPLRGSVIGAFNDLFRRVRSFFDDPALAHLDKRQRNARTHLLMEQVFWSGRWLRRYDVEDYGRVLERMSDILLNGLPTAERGWNPHALPDPTPLSPEGLEWRETFLVAATRLINQRGYRGASVEDISAALNVTKGSFYHHHDDKDALVAECFERTFTVTRRSQLDARALPTDSWTQLVSTAAGLTSYQLSEHGPLLRASSLGALPEPLRSDMADGYMRGWQRFASIISDGVADGSIRAIDASIAAHMINSMLNAAASLEAWVPGLQREEAADLFARPLLTGVLS
ncbi:TetR/AcrR family transcriptional regulator [Caulobacter vibrioides]|uniref:Transcriptional regulator, TetR family n=2 Tax=Caulobacter vibrioides TaxID=155892 RepID=Q9A3L1_CAUVC|nr:TetR/AcrR family transcriptional regulator [Caulobacter vibrioides]YP_002518668.1 TetR-family transcriptional regulator [Caulobacter vibrioides NA1000]AAK25154.1 transcriptional regulator, TetR family [Caulobacter vibrioides CB15]ACL96760.1 TetR-family transcriptional regulator [Caulobacter vibrioides NA1000]ATC30018.1 TetR/AcrR family transcriptional regulator [Caulobacter vibrioides]QXZ51539.1 TetR/AcrR family transcriptional regulator [Caulobacter vibrioides]